jgi:hypothetical protein
MVRPARVSKESTMGLLEMDPAKAEEYLAAAFERQKEQKAEEAGRQAEAAADPVRQAGLAAHEEWQASQRAEGDRLKAERLAAERAAGAAEATAAQERIEAALQRVATPEADVARLTAQAMDEWRRSRAVVAANADPAATLKTEMQAMRGSSGMVFEKPSAAPRGTMIVRDE